MHASSNGFICTNFQMSIDIFSFSPGYNNAPLIFPAFVGKTPFQEANVSRIALPIYSLSFANNLGVEYFLLDLRQDRFVQPQEW